MQHLWVRVVLKGEPKTSSGRLLGSVLGCYPTQFTMVGDGKGTLEGAPPRGTSEVRVGTPKRIKRVLGETLDPLRGINPDLFD